MMRLLLAVVLVFGILSCSKEEPPLSKQEVDRRVDSMITARRRESDEHARVDLEYRIKIEVKAKVDSILNARMNPVKKDSMIPGRKPSIH